MKFKVTDNSGRTQIVEYEWSKEDGIPNEETILENMETCNCQLNESTALCEGDCVKFDEGKVEMYRGMREKIITNPCPNCGKNQNNPLGACEHCGSGIC